MNPPHTTPTRILTLALTALVVLAPLAAAGILPSDVPGVTSAPWGAWGVETLDERWVTSDQTGIDLDRNDKPWITYTTTQQFYVLRHNGALWEVLFTGVESQSSELALDASDTPHIVHSGPYPGKVHYTTQAANGSWETTELDDRDLDFELHIALGPAGTPHVAYVVGNNLYHQKLTNSGWVREQVTVSGTAWGWLDLAVDSQGKPHIAHEVRETDQHPEQDPLGEIQYAVKDNGSWDLERFYGCNIDPAIGLDSGDSPHIACHVPDGGLGYATRNVSGSWNLGVIDDGARTAYTRDGFYVGHEPSITLDRDDRVHIAYGYKGDSAFDYPTHKGELHYIGQDGNGSWVKEIVDHDGHQNGRASAITLDTSNRPHISYVLGWRAESMGCAHVANTCYDLRYAKPLSEPMSTIGE